MLESGAEWRSLLLRSTANAPAAILETLNYTPKML
jgi:hypothetical protein